MTIEEKLKEISDITTSKNAGDALWLDVEFKTIQKQIELLSECIAELNAK